MMYFPAGFAYHFPRSSQAIFFTRLGASTDNIQTLHTANVDGTTNIDYTTGQCSISLFPGHRIILHFFYTVRDGAGTTHYIGPSDPACAGTRHHQCQRFTWVDANRYLSSPPLAGTGSLLLGNIASPTGVIYNGTGNNI